MNADEAFENYVAALRTIDKARVLLARAVLTAELVKIGGEWRLQELFAKAAVKAALED